MEQQSLFDETCQSIAIAFDGWGSQNHKHIIGGVGYWIGKTDWKRYRMVVEFADAKFGKSGEGMAEVLYTSFGEDIVKVDLIESKAGLMERTIKAVGLKINHKVIAVCGDNAPNNDTFCDHFHQKLQVDGYDDDIRIQGELNLKRCLFRGRRSRIRCLAHINSLIGEAVFKALDSGTAKEAKELL
jgi:hypothetical protein